MASASVSSVRQIPVPADARAISTLDRIDYEDAFLVDVGSVSSRTAEQWARSFMDDAPAQMRRALRSGWSAIGLKLGPESGDRFVIGWEVRRNSSDFVLLRAGSRIGMPGELLFKREPDALLFATFVQQENHMARAVWAGVEPVHVPIVRRVLEDGSRRCNPTRRSHQDADV